MDTSQILSFVSCGFILFMLGFLTACLLAANKKRDRKEEIGTPENPFDSIKDAIAASNGTGKVLWVNDPDYWNTHIGNEGENNGD